jgi:hypothetical protein
VQSLWRGKCARRELRRRRTEAREAGKLMQDKQALEVKLRELQNVLETVQNQRNELRQQCRVRVCLPGCYCPMPHIMPCRAGQSAAAAMVGLLTCCPPPARVPAAAGGEGAA